ncbi:hypothetical protein NM208_g2213 [Fusarium decemcellulare]|uniref:Uncharacterized protein n=1 Tax=Fusarium decemcellulare TaxID=57161 RepID=A0ACC1STP0_9HYPO|nr:hypothetical protein NM208_g2213 [Fusarium decemcellulare]
MGSPPAAPGLQAGATIHGWWPKLKEFWSENWDLFPETIRRSFLDAVGHAYQTNTNIKNASNHKLWRLAVTGNSIDLDWGVWIVLRITYYDVNLNEEDEKPLRQWLAFQKGAATKRIQERYPDIAVLGTDFPGTFPERPSSWPELGTKRQPVKPKKEAQEEQLSAVAPVEQTTQAGKESEPPADNTQPASSLCDGKPQTPLSNQAQLTSITLQRKRKAGANRGDMEDEPGDDDHATGPNKRLRRDIARDGAPSLASSGQQPPNLLLNAQVTMSYEEFERSVNNWGHRYGQPNAEPLSATKREVAHSPILPSIEASGIQQTPFTQPPLTQPPRMFPRVKREVHHSPALPSIVTNSMQHTPMANQPPEPARPLTTRPGSDVFNPLRLPDTASGDDLAKQTLAELLKEVKRDIDLLRARVEAMGAILPQV